MIKTNSLKQDVSVIDAFGVLVIVSDFELRISDFLNENLVFVQAPDIRTKGTDPFAA